MILFSGVILFWLTICGASHISLFRDSRVDIFLEDFGGSGLRLYIYKDNELDHVGNIGTNAGRLVSFQDAGERGMFLEFQRNQSLHVTIANNGINDYRVHFEWETSKINKLEDCLILGNKHWYGGPQQKRQIWPIEDLELKEYSYVTKEADNCAISEPYWLNSAGQYFYFDKTVPLFVNQASRYGCFIAQVKPPYSSKREINRLKYVMVISGNAKSAHKHAIDNYLGKPSGYPDERMIRSPIWSTWARYKRDVDHDSVIEFATEINSNKFENSQFEIDDLWETCYGSLTVDKNKFPDFRATNRQLKEMGFRVTVWAHPFINRGCEPYYSEALSKGYLVLSEEGNEQTSWWNDNGTTAAYVDFTNTDARDWWMNRLRTAQGEYEIDSFKFDAGESSWSPQVPVQNGNIEEHPSHITIEYIKAVSTFGSMVEVRAGQRTQHLPIFVRMVDKDTLWGFENGLATLVTTLLQMNMNGYPLVLPDMIGGNGYNEAPNKELFIRWLQANVFMPSLQFSYVPWEFDNETIEISKKFTDLHAEYSPTIIEACRAAVADGSPVNPPLWWVDPLDETALGIWDR